MAEAEERELCSSLDVEVNCQIKYLVKELVPSVGVEPTLGGF
jgi:hypothetical protein